LSKEDVIVIFFSGFISFSPVIIKFALLLDMELCIY